MLESQQERLNEEITEFTAKVDSARKELAELKVLLKEKFGDSIRLDKDN